ncbi:MAG: response regulator [Spirochaetaceae bacterium]
MEILFVDDEKEILSSIKRQFRKEKFTIDTCNSGNEALELLKAGNYKVILSDERMPEMNGLELMKQVKTLYPATIRIILSGYADSETIINAINQGEIFRFISKPWNYDEMLDCINQAIGKWESEVKKKKYIEQILEENRRLKMKLSFRDSSLVLDKQVIDEVNISIIAINEKGIIDNFNKYAKEELEKNFVIGDHITTIISKEMYKNIESGAHNNADQKDFELKISEHNYVIFIRLLRPSDPYKFLILFERIEG